MGKLEVLETGLPVAATEIRAMELGGLPARRDGRGVRLTAATVKEFRTVGRSRMIDAFGPDLMMPYDTSPKGRGNKVTGASVDVLEVMVRMLVAEGVPLARARTQADIADAFEAASHRRGRRPLGPRLIIRRQGRRPLMIYIKHGSQRITTHIEDRSGVDFRMQPGALAHLADYVEKVVRRILGHVLTKDVTMSQVYLQFLESRRPGERAHDLDWDNYNRLESICAQLEEHNGGDTFDMLTYESGIRYAKFRTARQIKTQNEDVDPDEMRCLADSTARDHVRVLVQAANWFCALHGLPLLVIRKPKVRRTGIRHLTWDQLIRLLLAARGWIFDQDGRRIGRHEDSEQYECVVRFIMLYLYTGTRHKNILELLWAADALLGHVDAALQEIVRQGPNATVTPKVRGTSELVGTIRSLVPRWEEEDREKRKKLHGSKQRFINVIHDELGEPVPEHRMLKLFREVREYAGMPWIKPHMLKHTGVTLFTYAGMGEEDISLNFSTSSETLDAVYTHLHAKWKRQRKFVKKNFRLLRLRRFSLRSREKEFSATAPEALADAA